MNPEDKRRAIETAAEADGIADDVKTVLDVSKRLAETEDFSEFDEEVLDMIWRRLGRPQPETT
jgi:hypothetical protein